MNWDSRNNNPVQLTDPFGLAAAAARLGGTAQSHMEDQAVAFAMSSQTGALVRHMDATPEPQPSIADWQEEYEARDRTHVMRTPLSGGNLALFREYQKTRHQMSMDQRVAFFAQMQIAHNVHLAQRAEFRARLDGIAGLIPGNPLAGALSLHDSAKVEYRYEHFDLFASGRASITFGAEPSTADYAESFLTWAPAMGKATGAFNKLRGPAQNLPLDSTSITVGLESRPLVSQVSVGIGVEGAPVKASLAPYLRSSTVEAGSHVIPPHGNSLKYIGETHVYAVRGPQGTVKIGESMQGVRAIDGASLRGEAQARALTKQTGDLYYSEIRRVFPDKRSAREYETRYIETYKRLFGRESLPGNKTNR